MQGNRATQHGPPERVEMRNAGEYPRYSFIHHSYDAESGFTPPLHVLFAGNAHWVKGTYRRRTNNTHFAPCLTVVGSMRFVQNGREYLVGPGQMRLIQKGCECEFEPGPEQRCITRVMRIDGPLLGTVLDVTGLAHCDVVTMRDPRRTASLYRRAHRLLQHKPDGFAVALSGIAFELIMDLAESYRYQGLPPLLAEALSLMDRRVSSRLTRDEVCDALGVSAATLTRLFIAHLGEAPMKYHARRRLELGATLLSSTSLSVKEVAARLGFDDPLYFSAEFKRRRGVAPSHYRSRTHQEAGG